MTKEFKPKKLRVLKYPKGSQKTLDDWFCDYVKPIILEKNLGMYRATINRYKKKIREEGQSLQDLVNVTTYIKLIELENEDWQQFINLSEIKKAEELERKQARKIDLEKQAKALSKELHKAGWKISIQAPKDKD